MSGGTEKREQILPSTEAEDTGFILPKYDFTANIKRPRQIGVESGNSLGSVAKAASGVIYYTDVIGFGESSNFMTRGMEFQPLGINFFMKTGLQCSNGADMWTYFEGIPRGDALGKSVTLAMNEMGLPKLKGLGPGIVEDAKSALNIKPVLNAAFGSVYPVCEQKTLPVGDARGNLVDRQTGDVWVKGSVQYKGGLPHQTRWVQKVENGKPVFLDRGEFDAAPKIYNPDGTAKIKEGFQDIRKENVLLAVVFCSLAFAVYKWKHT